MNGQPQPQPQPQQPAGPTRAEWEQAKAAVPLVDGGFAEENASQLMTRCQMLSQSDALSDSYRNKPANIMVANELAIALDVPLGIMLQNSFVHKGRVNPMCYLLLGCCQRSSVFDHKAFKVWTTGERFEDNYTWYCEGARVGGEVHVFSYTVEMARRAGLWDRKSKSGEPLPWKAHPDDMGRKMPIARMMRVLFSDVTMGLVTAEEMAHAKAVDDAVGGLDLSGDELTEQLTTAPEPEPQPEWTPEVAAARTGEPHAEPEPDPPAESEYDQGAPLYMKLDTEARRAIREAHGFKLYTECKDFDPDAMSNLLHDLKEAAKEKADANH